MKIKSNYPINEEAFSNLQKLSEEYEIIDSIEIQENDSNNKRVLKGTKEKECRFCKKQFPEVKFKNVSHTIPEFLGNKNLTSDFECDNCNKYFSAFENELANLLLPLNTLSSTKNKKNKTPKFKNKLEIHQDDKNVFHITNFPDDLINSKKEINFIIETASYIPEYVYRSLIKIGLSIINEEIIKNYNETIEWLMSLEQNVIIRPCLAFTIFPFNSPTDKIRCAIFDRKLNVTRQIPKTLLILSYKNFAIQTFFPVFPFEGFTELSPFPHVIPTALDLNNNLKNKKEYGLIYLDKNIRVKGEKIEVNIRSVEE
ncbi:hypothetical protein N0B40_02495 [Chryseobacterium oranimense]|uniref:HNH endonuclease n=1 Tax=Chryseobacterium oranimense TaxID=421058 RepID=UPI0021AEA911|nr:HNH endonuclease [Chryseobacterium oranimense]UWX61151.1 hypothetical protein N0B40_02495 [Chryseobacterium oranimense]